MDPHQIERIRIKVISLIRININLQMTSQNVWNVSLFEHFFKVLSLYLEARIRIRIKVKGKVRIRSRIEVKGRIRIRIKPTSCNDIKFAVCCSLTYGTFSGPYKK
jgi:hypothetical protein